MSAQCAALPQAYSAQVCILAFGSAELVCTRRFLFVLFVFFFNRRPVIGLRRHMMSSLHTYDELYMDQLKISPVFHSRPRLLLFTFVKIILKMYFKCISYLNS